MYILYLSCIESVLFNTRITYALSHRRIIKVLTRSLSLIYINVIIFFSSHFEWIRSIFDLSIPDTINRHSLFLSCSTVDQFPFSFLYKESRIVFTFVPHIHFPRYLLRFVVIQQW